MVSFLLRIKFESVESGIVPSDILQVLRCVEIKAISRKFNSEADGLAKDGINKAHLVESWVGGTV